jgi:hypothetical protein
LVRFSSTVPAIVGSRECDSELGEYGCVLQVAWGEPTMVEAEKMLFAAALEDPANQRFVLLSDRYGVSELIFYSSFMVRFMVKPL